MDRIIRKGIAFDQEQLKQFDNLIKKKGYKNRSEAIRDMIRDKLIEKEQENPEANMIGTLTTVSYTHLTLPTKA